MSIVRSPVRSCVRSPVQGVFGGSASLLEQATSALGNVAPYHWLDFINNRALYAGADVGNVTGATGYSFTRASTGYYQNADGTLTLFGSGALRRGDRGVLIEGARTNLLLRSQEFDNAAWALDDTLAFGSGSVANAIAAPDGTVTADLIVPTTSNVGTHRIRQAQVTATVAHCIIWFVKAGGYSKVGIREGNITGAYATFNLSGAGTVLDSGSGGTGSIRALANGWYQIVLAFTAGATARADLHVLADGYTTGSPASYSYAGNGTSGLYIWQADLQAGAFPSSPIVTVAAASTRAADVLTYTAGVSYPLSLWAEFERGESNINAGILSLDVSPTERMRLFLNATYQPQLITIAGGATQVDLVASAAPVAGIGASQKTAVRVQTNDVQIATASVLATADTSATNPSTPTTIQLGTNISGAYLFSYIRRAAVFNSALTDAQLQTTTS